MLVSLVLIEQIKMVHWSPHDPKQILIVDKDHIASLYNYETKL